VENLHFRRNTLLPLPDPFSMGFLFWRMPARKNKSQPAGAWLLTFTHQVHKKSAL
jgi:hypothetical protein